MSERRLSLKIFAIRKNRAAYAVFSFHGIETTSETKGLPQSGFQKLSSRTAFRKPSRGITSLRNCQKITCTSGLSKFPCASLSGLDVALLRLRPFRLAHENLYCAICTGYFSPVPHGRKPTYIFCLSPLIIASMFCKGKGRFCVSSLFCYSSSSFPRICRTFRFFCICAGLMAAHS